MDYEIQNLFDLDEFTVVENTVFKIYQHKNKNIIIVETGVGKVNAAAACQYAMSLEAEKYVNVGVVGSFNNDFAIGSIHAIDSTIFWDVDVSALGFAVGQIPFNGLTRYQLSSLDDDTSISSTTNIISGDSFVSDITPVAEFAQSFKAELLDMELAAIAHVFYLHKKQARLSSIKSVSDHLNTDSANDFSNDSDQKFARLRDVVSKIIQKV